MRFDRDAFAAKRRKAQEDIIAALEPVVKRALAAKAEGSQTWWRQIVDAAKALFDQFVVDDGGTADKARVEWAHLSLDLTHSLTKTKKVEQYTETLIATWVSSNILSYATEAAARQAGEPFLLEWISMHDGKVRSTHRIADGQKVRPGFPFHVGTASMRRPGDTTAPIGEWINCRCTIAPVSIHDNQAASVDTGPRTRGVTMKKLPTLYGDALVAAIAQPDLIPWHGPLAPEGVWSGDRRRFAKGGVSHRDLPLPLTYQKQSQPGHDGNETVASIDWMDKRGDVWHGGGMMLPTELADELVGLLAHFGKYGVSIDGDMAEFDLIEYDGGGGTDDIPGTEFTNVRVSGACACSIPAFQQAWITLGEDPDHDYGRPAEDTADEVPASLADLTLGEDPPESLPLVDAGDDSSVAAGRGPGWITDPKDTERIHAYWTRPGEPGYDKIGWGAPGGGDFNRCRVEVGSEIGEESPEKLRFLNQICAQWHKDATGFWPGHAPTEQATLDQPEGEMAPAVSLVASASTVLAPAEWFKVPEPDHVQPFTVTAEGQVFGHLADWTTCHMNAGNPGQCIVPPHSASNYSIFLGGEVLTDEGPVATGSITLATGHADTRLAMRPALAHYDNTGSAVADVVATDGEYGVWLCGWVRPWVSEEKVYELRASKLSGDWRRVPGTRDMELIAALGVNSQGFPVARRVGVAAGVQESLIASLAPEEDAEDAMGALAEAVVAALEKRQQTRAEFAALTLEDA